MKIPDQIIKLIEESWSKPGLTAESILRQSDFYIENPKTATPWDKDYARKAQLAYYLPLNLVRSLRVYSQLKNNPLQNYEDFFSGIDNYWELGSGLSPSYFALKEAFPQLKFANVNFIESSTYAQDFHKELLAQYLQNLTAHHWTKLPPSRSDNITNDLVVCSYSLTELESVPEWLFQAKALIIIEPATREDGRKLLQLRAELIARGFQIWSPCLHQLACPLLQETKNDWCHDRVHFEKPTALQKIENLLPIKNETLTLSYLIAKKVETNSHKSNTKSKLAQTVSATAKTELVENKATTTASTGTEAEPETENMPTTQLKSETRNKATATPTASAVINANTNTNTNANTNTQTETETENAVELTNNLVRVVGDFLNEKGKARQMICRNSKREFLTQLKRNTTPLAFERGDLLKISGPIKTMANEIRTEPAITELTKLNID